MKKAVFALILSAILMTGCSLQEDEPLNSDPVTFEYSGITTPPETTETTAVETEETETEAETSENTEISIEFRIGKDINSEPVLTEKDIVRAEYKDVNLIERHDHAVRVWFSEEGTKIFADVTAELLNSDEPLSIWFNGEMISAPVMGGAPVTNGETIITGNFTEEFARELADYLNNGERS